MTFSCDVNSANLYFLENQGKILVEKHNGFIFRKYIGSKPNRCGWMFPREVVPVLKDYFCALLQIDSSPNFILLTEEQKLALEVCVEEFFPEYKIAFESNDGDSDYIYSVEKMADLPGKDFQKKRNHVSRFLRTYEENWTFEFFDSDSITPNKLNDLKVIFTEWKKSCKQTDDFLQMEENSFQTAIDLNIFQKLKLIAGILYIENKPSAFIVSSFTHDLCLNVHFEKCLDNVAKNGALAVLNQQFAKTVKQNFPECKYLNREEDLNIPGLRKSKLSYKPESLIKKYFGKIERR